MEDSLRALLAGIGFLALNAPIFVCLALAVLRGRGVRGRWLFLFAGPVLAYTVLWVFTLVVIVPAMAVLALLAPASKELFNVMPYWFQVAAWVTKYQYFLAAVASGSLAAWLAIWVWPRWPAILYALAQPPGSPRGSSLPTAENEA